MAASFTALVSLMNTIDLIQNHSRHSLLFDRNQINSLLIIAQLFLEFTESFNSHGRSKEVEHLETQIASAARLAEDLLESHILDQILGKKSRSFLHKLPTKIKAMKIEVVKVLKKIRWNVDADYLKQNRRILSLFPSTEKSPGYLFDLEEVLEDCMYSILIKVEKVKGAGRFRDKQPTDFIGAASSRIPKTGIENSTMVGFDDYSFLLMDVLTGQQSNRQLISVVGMGGIGKTTLARNVYENSVIVQRFDVRAWATISQVYSIREILLELLSRKGESTRDTVDALGEQLHKKLSGRRYLIVLDDMWSSHVWEEMKFFFPENGSRSRIVVTTRLSYVAGNFNSFSLVMGLLGIDKSWELFCAKTFGEEDCPLNLVEIGKKIVEKCKGLPLSIVVIGGHLRKCLRTKKQWVEVARNMISFLNSGDGEEQCLSILSLSYSHLPIYLKPCFLYMGIFPEDEDIVVSTLIRLWVAEGFLRCNGDQRSEEIAEGYLKELIERNLISVKLRGREGKILSCNIHDLVRELCLKVAKEERFFCVLNHPAATSRCCTSCTMNNNGRYRIESSRLLRILPQPQDNWHEDEFDPVGLLAKFQHFNIRYIFGNVYCHPSLRYPPYVDLPSLISLHWNLQTIVIRVLDAKILAPCEIWEMPQLRHVDISHLILPSPPPLIADDYVMRNLQTLSTVENFKLGEEVCLRVPNLEELHLRYDLQASSSSNTEHYAYNDEISWSSNIEAATSFDYDQQNLCSFHRLESLRLDFCGTRNWRPFTTRLTFPGSLKELGLGSSSLHWKDLSMIGSLPHLEVLTLTDVHSVRGDEWSPIDGEFPRLKSLTISHCYDLVHWNVERSHFPVLETLTLKYAFKLVELPSNVGDIPTLGRVYLDRCSLLAAISAMRMLVEQHELGNDELRLTIKIDDEREMESVKKMVQEEGLESKNLRVKYYPSKNPVKTLNKNNSFYSRGKE